MYIYLKIMSETYKLKVALYALKNNKETPLTYQTVSELFGLNVQTSQNMLGHLRKYKILYQKRGTNGWFFNSKMDEKELYKILRTYTCDEILQKNDSKPSSP